MTAGVVTGYPLAARDLDVAAQTVRHMAEHMKITRPAAGSRGQAASRG